MTQAASYILLTRLMRCIYGFKATFLLLLLLCSSIVVFAQNTIITGTVTDATSNRPLSYVTVAFPGTGKVYALNHQRLPYQITNIFYRL
jgi:hypothetical protein